MYWRSVQRAPLALARRSTTSKSLKGHQGVDMLVPLESAAASGAGPGVGKDGVPLTFFSEIFLYIGRCLLCCVTHEMSINFLQMWI
jgi:hypothetical protein